MSQIPLSVEVLSLFYIISSLTTLTLLRVLVVMMATSDLTLQGGFWGPLYNLVFLSIRIPIRSHRVSTFPRRDV
jgi:hypothetical protein